MSIVETRATASVKYYMNKSRNEILYRLMILHECARGEKPPQSLRDEWCAQKKRDLACIAMDYHKELPAE